MDESSLESMHFGNSIAVKDEETDYSTAKLDFHKLIDEKQSIENSHVGEAISFEKEVKKLGPILFLGPGAKPHTIVAHKNKDLSPAEERRVHYALPSPLHFKPFIRKKVRQEEIVFNRECKKLEKVWTNRGLPVDRETVCSAASKDAFDLKDLSESLPSTSTSVNKPSIIEIEKGCQVRPSTGMVSLFHKSTGVVSWFHERLANMERTPNRVFPTLNPRYFKHSCNATIAGLPVSETTPSACNSQMETVQNIRFMSLVRARRRARLRSYALLQEKRLLPWLYSEKPDCDEQKEASEDSLDSKLKKVLSNMTHVHQELSQNPLFKTSEQPNFGSEFAKMSIDDKQDEKKKETQDSGDENHLSSRVLNSLPLIMKNFVPKMELPSSWDPDKNWNTIFDQISQQFDHIAEAFSDLPAPVPFNSPSKKDENAGKSDLFWSMEKELAKVRMNALKHMREQNKEKALNCYRRILLGNEDSSESEKPSLEKASTVVSQKVPKMDSSTQTERISIKKLKEHKEMIKEMKLSIKSVRTFHNPFSRRHIVRSDKVVPD